MLRGVTRNVFGYIYPIDADTNANAFSLRKLRTAYSGNTVRVRRSSDNTEQDIGFVGNDFDSAAFSSFIGAGQGFVSKWYNQGLLGVDAAQATTTRQPGIILSGISGKPCLTFNGSQDLVVSFSLNQPSCSILLANATAGITTLNMSLLEGATGNNRRFYLSGTSGTSRTPTLNSGANFTSGFGSTSYTMGTPAIFAGVFNTANTLSRIFLNSNKGTSGVSGANNATSISIGGLNGSSAQLTGQISELITYASDIGDTAITTIISAINNYYYAY